uniref:Secreted protein n=1 Tax=Rodentolepis nana TaxID=102285 RepID=A0A0R3TYE8_RODNA
LEVFVAYSRHLHHLFLLHLQPRSWRLRHHCLLPHLKPRRNLTDSHCACCYAESCQLGSDKVQVALYRDFRYLWLCLHMSPDESFQ